MSGFGPRRDPVRLLVSPTLRACVWYLLAYQGVGWMLFAVALAIAVGGGGLSLTLAGLPVLVAAAAVIRWCADVERARLRALTGEDVRGGYRSFAGSGLLARMRAAWTDPQVWRDLAYLVGLLVPLMALDITVLAVWLTFLAGITLPAWYWAPWQTVHGVRYHGYELGYFPNGPHGHGWGLYVDTLPKALLTAVACLILFLLFNYVLVATARLHARAARALLGASQDPLREAKDVLTRPGPLGGALLR